MEVRQLARSSVSEGQKLDGFSEHARTDSRALPKETCEAVLVAVYETGCGGPDEGARADEQEHAEEQRREVEERGLSRKRVIDQSQAMQRYMERRNVPCWSQVKSG